MSLRQIDNNATMDSAAIPLNLAQRRMLITLRGALMAVVRMIDALLQS